MAAGNSGRALFYSILQGKICRSFQSATSKSVQRTNKNNKIVHEEFYDWIDGIITEITTKEHAEYGKFWLIRLQDGETSQILQMNFSSGYSQAFLKLLPNVDLSSSVKIIPSEKEVEGKKKTSIFITQHGKSLKHFWTKDLPGDLPPLRKIKIKGKESWDDSDQMEFFEEYVRAEVAPKLSHSTHSASAAPSHVPGASNETEPIEEGPF